MEGDCTRYTLPLDRHPRRGQRVHGTLLCAPIAEPSTRHILPGLHARTGQLRSLPQARCAAHSNVSAISIRSSVEIVYLISMPLQCVISSRSHWSTSPYRISTVSKTTAVTTSEALPTESFFPKSESLNRLTFREALPLHTQLSSAIRSLPLAAIVFNLNALTCLVPAPNLDSEIWSGGYTVRYFSGREQ